MSQGRRILIIDDEEDVRFAFRKMMAPGGHDVRTAETAAEGLSAMRTVDIDIVFLDIWMPGTNGMETLVRIRQLDPMVPVVAISGMATASTVEACFANGASAFLAKPFSADHIDETMGSIVAETAKKKEEMAAGLISGPKGVILVADDHDAYRDALVEHLRFKGFTVDAARSGRDAIALAGERRYDLFLLDIHMPDGDGIFAAREIISKIDSKAPIMFMTGEATSAEVAAAREIAEGGCLQKPLRMENVDKLLLFFIESRRNSRRRAAARAKYDHLPLLRKAAIVSHHKLRHIRRSDSVRRTALLFVAAILISLLAIQVVDAGLRNVLGVKSYLAEKESPWDMYHRIVGYLERDEDREVGSGT